MNREMNIDFDRYIIEKDGSIYSKYWNKPLKEIKVNNKNYYYNFLKTKNGKKEYFLRHRVIWSFFNGEIPDDMEIDHINGNSTDNRLENLRCVTHSDNMNNPISIERLRQANIGEKNPMFGKTMSEETKKKISKSMKKIYADGIIDKNKAIGQFNCEGELITEWKSATDCSRNTDFKQSGIFNALNGGYFDKTRGKWHNIKQYKGFIWKYL